MLLLVKPIRKGITMKVTGKGILKHFFHGTYYCGIALEFLDENTARDAKVVLGEDWKPGTKATNALVWFGDGAALDALKIRFADMNYKSNPCGMRHCKHQCKDAAIDNVNHSVDVGATFTIEVDVTPPEQGRLF